MHYPLQQNYFQTTALQKEIPFLQFNVPSYKRQGIRLLLNTQQRGFQGEVEREESG